MAELGAYLAIGAAAGFFAGLLGVGGGIVIVSSLALIYKAHGFPPDWVMRMAVGTSLSAIVVGSWSSLRAHHRRGSVDWKAVKGMTPGILAGVLGGSAIARLAAPGFLKYFFLGFALLVTVQMALDVRPAASRELPSPKVQAMVGAVIGLVASFFGGGAAALGVPFLTWCNMKTHRAIGTVAALGFPIAVAGTAGYMVAGASVPGLPRWSLGFVYLPALAGISASSMLLAPLGVRLAHRLRGATLRRIFALFLAAMLAKVAISV